MFAIKFWVDGENFTQIGQGTGAQMALFNCDGVLKTSAAALDTFSKMRVYLKQAQRHSTLFQRLRCP